MTKPYKERLPSLFIPIFLLFLFSGLPTAPAAGSIPDSTEMQLQAMPDDTAKVNLLNRIAYSYYSKQPAVTQELAEQALRISIRLKDLKGISTAYYLLGLSYTFRDNYLPAVTAERKAIGYAAQIKDFGLLSRAYNTLGLCNSRLGDDEAALANYRKAAAAIDKMPDTTFKAAIIHNMGSIYVRSHNYEQGLQNFFKALELNLKTGNYSWQVQNYYEIGLAYFELKEYREAKSYTRKALQISSKFNYAKAYVKSLRLMGAISIDLGKVAAAKKYLDSGLRQAGLKNMQREKMELYGEYARLYERRHHYRKALYFQRLQDSLYKNLYNSASSRNALDYLAKFELEHQELENKLLRQKQQTRANELKQRNEMLVGTLAALLAILLFSITLLLKNRKIGQKNELQRLQYQEIQQQKEKVEELNSIKDKLFSLIAHDLRSPLAALKNMMEFYEAGFLSQEDAAHLFKQLSADVGSLNNLLDNLLIWSKSQMQGFNLKPGTIPLKELFDELLHLFTTSAEAKKITVENLIHMEQYVFADYEMAKVIARNLLANAMKFTPANGTISVSSQEKENFVVIAVADSGIGIQQKQKDKIFQNTFHSTTGLMNEKGTGIGLQICKEFVEKNGGRIWFESEVNRGSTFFFSLPLDSASPANINRSLMSAEECTFGAKSSGLREKNQMEPYELN